MAKKSKQEKGCKNPVHVRAQHVKEHTIKVHTVKAHSVKAYKRHCPKR